MKISNSKKELARIISENGGWRDEAEWAAQDEIIAFFSGGKPEYTKGDMIWSSNGEDGDCVSGIEGVNKIANWHQTILSREEYFHLYPAPDADGWIEWSGGDASPVAKGVAVDVKMKNGTEHYGQLLSDACWRDSWGEARVIAYRLNKPEQAKPRFCDSVMRSIPEPSDKPTIEQLASDYQAKLDIATRAQEEADAHRCGAEVALSKLEIAVKELGFRIELVTAKQEPELVITDWRDLQAGDVISVSGKWWEPDSEYTVNENDGSRDAPIRVGGYWALIGECSFKFISRP